MGKILTKHGNSYAIIINKPIMELLGIDASTELDFKINGQALTISRAEVRSCDSTFVPKDVRLQKVVEETIKKYDSALRRLAKN